MGYGQGPKGSPNQILIILKEDTNTYTPQPHAEFKKR